MASPTVLTPDKYATGTNAVCAPFKIATLRSL